MKEFEASVKRHLFKGEKPNRETINEYLQKIAYPLSNVLPMVQPNLNYVRNVCFAGKDPKKVPPTYIPPVNIDKIYKTDKLNEIHAFIGVIGESIELYLSWIKNEDKENLVSEMGDVLWFVQLLCIEIGISLEEVMKKNIEKLDKRNSSGG
jgi:NTP pyrophosphatase (non-canonical NTP hydrolase)